MSLAVTPEMSVSSDCASAMMKPPGGWGGRGLALPGRPMEVGGSRLKSPGGKQELRCGRPTIVGSASRDRAERRFTGCHRVVCPLRERPFPTVGRVGGWSTT